MVMEQFIKDVDIAFTDDRARSIIHERYGLDDDNPQCLEPIGKHYGISKSRVGQIEAKALRMLRSNKNIHKYEILNKN